MNNEKHKEDNPSRDKDPVVDFIWDDEAEVWCATSKDVPGLVLESEILDTLMEKVRASVPELLKFNDRAPVSCVTCRVHDRKLVVDDIIGPFDTFEEFLEELNSDDE